MDRDALPVKCSWHNCFIFRISFGFITAVSTKEP